jgi:hypothetical protein
MSPIAAVKLAFLTKELEQTSSRDRYQRLQRRQQEVKAKYDRMYSEARKMVDKNQPFDLDLLAKGGMTLERLDEFEIHILSEIDARIRRSDLVFFLGNIWAEYRPWTSLENRQASHYRKPIIGIEVDGATLSPTIRAICRVVVRLPLKSGDLRAELEKALASRT